MQGEKVTLRPYRREDAQRQWELYQDMELWLLDASIPAPMSLEHVQGVMEKLAAQGPGPDANFAIEADGTYIGGCELTGFHQFNRTYTLGIQIGDRAFWGKGYGRDAVRLLLAYAFRYRNAHKVTLGVSAENERAVRCYRACGFVEEGRARQGAWVDGRYVDMLSMGILRDEWTRSRATDGGSSPETATV